ncbi:MAG: Uma2 family endonuclease [Armatimonadetes bacterium]|nr:Uma2 family endonuclease [Anaerolineae bacterium]
MELLLSTYLEQTTGGEVIQEGIAHRPDEGFPGRVPDLMVLLPPKSAQIKGARFDGVADLIVEVISPDSQHRDRVEKVLEYAQAGVREYWIIDPIRQEALFYVLAANGVYAMQYPVEGVYTAQVLSGLSVEVAILWREPLPGVMETIALAQKTGE